MTKFEVIAYETENGDNPVEKFLDKLNESQDIWNVSHFTGKTISKSTTS